MSQLLKSLTDRLDLTHPWFTIRPQAKANIPHTLQLLLTTANSFTVAEREAVAQLVVASYDTGVFPQLSQPSARLEAAAGLTEQLIVAPNSLAKEDLDFYGETFNPDELVSLQQLVSFLSFYLRLATALDLLSDQPKTQLTATAQLGPQALPQTFTLANLGWRPWIDAPAKSEMTAKQLDSLIEPERANMPYFRLLARDPEVLKARTLIDFDIFTNENDGAPRWARELAAVAVSLTNGCRYCCSVHARRTAQYANAEAEVAAYLATKQTENPVWQAIAAAATALTQTPAQLTAKETTNLAAAGFSPLAIADILAGAAFFNWANRLMLGLGHATDE